MKAIVSSVNKITARTICGELSAFMKFYKTNLAELAEKYNLTPIQLFAMNALQQKQTAGEGGTMSGLANALHCDASNVTGIVDRLSALKFITRQENPNDRRVKTLQLTAHGQAVLNAINADLPAKLNCTLLTAEERSQLHGLLVKLNPKILNPDLANNQK